MAMHNLVSKRSDTASGGFDGSKNIPRFGSSSGAFQPSRGGSGGGGGGARFGGVERGGGGGGGGAGGRGGGFWGDVLFRGQRAEMAHRARANGDRDGGGGGGGLRGGEDGSSSSDGLEAGSGSGDRSPRDGGGGGGDRGPSSPQDDGRERDGERSGSPRSSRSGGGGGEIVRSEPRLPLAAPAPAILLSVPEKKVQVPSLAHADLFWRAAVVALVLAATNPGSVGRELWETSPTMRCLMQVWFCCCGGRFGGGGH